MSEERRNWLDQVVGQTWYEYDARGRASYVTRRFADDPWLRGTRLYYDSREHLWLAIAEKWQVDGLGNPMNCQRTSAMEYRYDEGRAMYMVRPRNPATLANDDNAAGSWRDHDGVDIFTDYTISTGGGTPAATSHVSHAAGLGQFDLDAPANAARSYFHGNLVGTNEVVSDQSSVVSARRVYTAFGEPVYEDCGTGVPPVCSRYGYVGAWGYEAPESGDPLEELGWLHVGERYYDPASGRFVQRDPIGIEGGANPYTYVGNRATQMLDPSGLAAWSNSPPGNPPPNVLPRSGVWPNTPARLPSQQERTIAALQQQIADLQRQINDLQKTKEDKEDKGIISIDDPSITDPTGILTLSGKPVRKNWQAIVCQFIDAAKSFPEDVQRVFRENFP